jgi:hypothetical protein
MSEKENEQKGKLFKGEKILTRVRAFFSKSDSDLTLNQCEIANGTIKLSFEFN